MSDNFQQDIFEQNFWQLDTFGAGDAEAFVGEGRFWYQGWFLSGSFASKWFSGRGGLADVYVPVVHYHSLEGPNKDYVELVGPQSGLYLLEGITQIIIDGSQ